MSFNTFDRGIFYAPSDGDGGKRRYQNRVDVQPGMRRAPKATFEEVTHNGLRLSLTEYEDTVIEPQRHKWPQAAWTLDFDEYAETLGLDADRMREFRLKLEQEDIIQPLKLHGLSHIRTVMGYYDQPRARALAAIRFWTQDIEDYRDADLTEKIVSLKQALGKNPVNDYIHLPEEDTPAQAAREYDYSKIADPVMREHMKTHVEYHIKARKEEDWPIFTSQLGRMSYAREIFSMDEVQLRRFHRDVKDSNIMYFVPIEKGGNGSPRILYPVIDKDRMRALAALSMVYKKYVTRRATFVEETAPIHTIVAETKRLLGEGNPLALLLRYPSLPIKQPEAPRKTPLSPISPVTTPHTVFQPQIGLQQHFSDMTNERVEILTNGYKLDDLKKLRIVWGRGHAAIDVRSEIGYRDPVRVIYALDSLRKALVARTTPDFSIPLGTVPVADLLPKLKAAIDFMEQNNMSDLGMLYKLILRKTSGK